jgi:hypothetical protein
MEMQLSKTSLYYEVYGTGHPILILHGMSLDHRSMSAPRK